MQIQELDLNQLSPEEIAIISNELGIPKQEVANGNNNAPSQTQQFTPQYNPYQYMQPNPYNQNTQQYYGGYYQQPVQYNPTQYQQYGYNPYQYQSTYQQYGYNYQYQNPYYNQYPNQYSTYPQYYQTQQPDYNAYQQQYYMDNKFMYNPYYSYIKLMTNYDPNRQSPYNTYFGYSAYNYNPASQYGMNPTNEQISTYGGVDGFLKSQYEIFMRISKGVSSLNKPLSDNQIIDHYKKETKMPDPVDVEKETGLTFNRIIYTPEQQRINNNQMHVDQIAMISERNEQIFKYNKMMADKAREEFSRRQKERLPDTTTFAQFLKVGGQIYAEALYDEYIQTCRRNMTNSYNQSKFSSFVNNGGINQGYFGNIFRPATDISDITITLPDHLKNNYDKRRDKFIEAIINKTM